MNSRSDFMQNEKPQQNFGDLSGIFLGVVCPVANEQDTAESFVREVLKQCSSVGKTVFYAVLDCKSVDNTLPILRNLSNELPQLQVIWAPENTCVVDAYVRGYRQAICDQCDWILEIDAGFSHQPSEIPRFLETMAQGCDCAFGSRFCPGGRFASGSFSRYCISRGGTFLVNLFLGTRMKDMTSGFEMFTRSALCKILEKGIRSKGHFFQTEIRVHARKWSIAEVPIHYQTPSPSLNLKIICDALLQLTRLFKMRLKGRL